MKSRLTINQAQMQRVLTGPDSAAVKTIKEAQRLTTNSAKVKSPVDTGQLRNSHKSSNIIVQGGKVTGDVEAVQDYATAVHEGSRPHVIRPKNVSALTFVVPGAGRVFATSVRHPGAKARPWLLNAAEEAAGRLGFTVTPAK